MARIATVCSDSRQPWDPRDMSFIRWQKISEALAKLGHEVDIVTNESGLDKIRKPVVMRQGLRRVPLDGIDWSRYDVVKTLFHGGFDLLELYGGARHPFIIAKLGSVVSSEDVPGIYFYGEVRRRLFETQSKIQRAARYVTVLSEPAANLLTQVHGFREGILCIPGGVDEAIPAPTRNPFADAPGKVCLFSGNVYFQDAQSEANRVLVDKLNTLGELLHNSGIRLCFQGIGDTSRLDARYVSNVGSAPYEDTWNWLQHADVGIVVSAGQFMHNNESSKIYHYLRAGLPVVSESGFPNESVIRSSGLGIVVPSGDMAEMAAQIRNAAAANWDRASAIEYIRQHHTWDVRAQTYERIIPKSTAGGVERWRRWLDLHPMSSVPAALRRRAARCIDRMRAKGPTR